MKTRLILGAGYLGLRVARAWRADGDRVIVSTRSETRASEWQKLGLESIVVDVTCPDTLENVPSADTVLYAIGFDRSAGLDRRLVYVEGLKYFLNALPSLSDRLVFISSTGVHGERGGEWIDEQTLPAPIREAGQVCWEAEQVLLESKWASRCVRLRLAGIYGPQRIPLAESIRCGQTIPVVEDSFLNLIHVEDAVEIVRAADRLPVPSLYLVSDGNPVRRGDFYREVARQLGIEVHFDTHASATSRADRSGDNKRVNAAKLVRDLGIRFHYPTYQEGISAIIQVERAADMETP